MKNSWPSSRWEEWDVRLDSFWNLGSSEEPNIFKYYKKWGNGSSTEDCFCYKIIWKLRFSWLPTGSLLDLYIPRWLFSNYLRDFHIMTALPGRYVGYAKDLLEMFAHGSLAIYNMDWTQYLLLRRPICHGVYYVCSSNLANMEVCSFISRGVFEIAVSNC